MKKPKFKVGDKVIGKFEKGVNAFIIDGLYVGNDGNQNYLVGGFVYNFDRVYRKPTLKEIKTYFNN